MTKQEKWDLHFLGMALYCARMAKDSNTRVGSVMTPLITQPTRED